MINIPLTVKRTFFAASASALLFAPAVASAGLKANIEKGAKDTGQGAGLGQTPLAETVGKVIQAFLGLIGVVLVVLIIYAGFLWMTASGNEEQVTKAKTIIKNAVIGMVILMAAYAISNFVLTSVLEGTGAT